MRGQGEVLVVSCYELGRQPVAAAGALAALEENGFHPAVLDVAVESLEEDAVKRARLVAISVPMHTALRLGVRVAARVRTLNPAAHVAFFGLYAGLNKTHLLDARHCDTVIEGEVFAPLVALARSLGSTASGSPTSLAIGAAGGSATTAAAPTLEKRGTVPSRAALPVLSKYARLEGHGPPRLVASVEASHGCLHLCRHCPIVPVYRGRFVAVPREAVLADLEQQLAQGASHVTFGDPDFFNGPTHALRLARELHARWPHLTFDATIKIEHLLRHRALLPELAASGCLFITTAVESLSERVLHELRKGHTAAEVPLALQAVRAAGIDLRPTLLPYTPWTALGDLPALFDFAEEHDLVDQIDPVQFTLRLLLPPGSALLADPAELRPWLGELRPEMFSWSWTHADPRVDELQRASAAIAEHATFAELRALAESAAGHAPRASRPVRARREVPRLTEPWFC